MMIKTTLSGVQKTKREITPRGADPKPLTRNFLIANPRLEFLLTHTKQSPLKISNREYIAVFHSKSNTQFVSFVTLLESTHLYVMLPTFIRTPSSSTPAALPHLTPASMPEQNQPQILERAGNLASI